MQPLISFRPPSTQIMVSKYHCQFKNNNNNKPGFLISEQEMDKINLEHIIPESKKALKHQYNHVQKTQKLA